ncbi:hypothetical protein [Marinomonas posidonica]|uniref:Uncharacterized protein n=1 Tax=Marinomonas posidonica (strain CECT 7376 / NCIMB 14433 / IVIA-Po-181) TaxID=491952 RepID=F6CYI4_MARPP|nr:hypothetical protein [Marinomonas posidonica]AEF54593.1 hypothetical protein Mar181_1552 [Marinomonas posidonica IVIA-Po-181]
MIDNYSIKNDAPHGDVLKYSQQATAVTVLLSIDTLDATTPKIRDNAFCLLMKQLKNHEQTIERMPIA